MTATVSKAPAFTLRRLDLAAGDAATAATVERLCRRAAVPNPAVRDAVRAILDDVRQRGDAAVVEAGEAFGGGPADGRLVIRAAELEAAARSLPADVRAALDEAIATVRAFAEPQVPASSAVETVPGVFVERRWLPLRRVGCYVPGGGAPYPSSLVMTVVPARVAGVDEIVVASPAGPDSRIDPVVAGAAGLLGVDALLVAGGAQAVGALAFGLPDADLEPVDRIVGPGNAWVTAAKIEVSALVGIDLPAGPSEGMVLADASANPALVAADLVTQAEHGPDSPALLVTTDTALADAVVAEVAALLSRLERAPILEAALRDHGWIVLAPDLDAAIAFVDAYAPEHLSVDVADAEGAVARIRNAASIFVGPWAPESAGDYATGANHVLPTGGLARSSGPLSVEAYGRYSQIQRIDQTGLERLAPTIRTLATAEGLTAHRYAVDARFGAARRRRGPVMSPTPVTYTLPDQPASYSWEATDEEVAARYGVDPATIVQFDLNTSPTPPGLAARLLAAGAFESPLSEYPPSDYRRLVEAAAETYGVAKDELLVGAGADEILDLVGKAFLPPGGRAVIPTPSYAMYRVVTEQRGATVVAVPRRSEDAGWAVDVEAVRTAAGESHVVWLCSPNNPTALAEPDGTIQDLLEGIAHDAATAGRPLAIVVLDEAYAEFVGTSLLPLRLEHPNLVVVRTASKAYALAGLRVGFAIARPETIARIAPYRPPGSVATTSVTIVTEALRDPAAMHENRARVERERERLSAGLAEAGWRVGPSVTNFLLVRFTDPSAASAAAETLLRYGLVPRTFGAGHPLADSLRLTVRDPRENDRLIEAARSQR